MNWKDSEIWWNSIAGPSTLVSSIADSLMDIKSVLIHVPEELPWRKQMRSAVEAAFREKDSDMLIEYVDCQTDMEDGESAGDYILKRFSSTEVANGYRSSSGLTISQYIKANEVLKNRVLWVKGTTPENVEKWCEFCKQYHAKKRKDGLFMIEEHHGSFMKSIPSYICEHSYENNVSYFDALLFNNTVAAHMDERPAWKQYLATLAACLCGSDVELSAWLIENAVYEENLPIKALQRATCEDGFTKRAEAEMLSPEHPFALLRDDRIDKLRQAGWRAQMQIIFPMLELERTAFVATYYDQIAEALNTEYIDNRTGKSTYVYQLYERVQRPEDAEIGTLFNMNKVRRASDSQQYLLYLPREDERNRLELLHGMRNTIAHMNLCEWEKVTEFLNSYSYPWNAGSTQETGV